MTENLIRNEYYIGRKNVRRPPIFMCVVLSLTPAAILIASAWILI